MMAKGHDDDHDQTSMIKMARILVGPNQINTALDRLQNEF